MIVSCKPGCKIDNTCDVKLSKKTGEVICTKCKEIMPSTPYLKRSLELSNDFVKETSTKKALEFECVTCKQVIQIDEYKNKLKGKGCETEECSFEVKLTPFLKQALKIIHTDISED
jgi:hypothetical protein